MKKSALVLLIILILSGCNGKVETQSVKEETPADKDLSTDIDNSWFYNLSDKDVENAIKEGSAADLKWIDNFEKKYSLPVAENRLNSMKEYPPEAYLRTPYFEIVEESYTTSQKYGNLDLETARQKIYHFVLSITFTTYGNNVSMADKFYAVLKQGNNVVQHSQDKLIGSEKLAVDIHKRKDNDPKYTQTVSATFGVVDKIDLQKPFELIFIYNGKEDSISYTIDLKKYK